ncbi:HBL231Cp [Eremothecium sinecaudum]|uniref:C-1-tetrahydrofolate synthase, cytoplasmic n=1 Tax=Eremothecium sinecaudum TaxID=45286 RepID=A0A109UW48_9SACH|nr:HBL231Cp [Eremothecium sinecaudum]AMD18671.1 HBL231Cp [Eremothecium sinecaudum]
MAIIDGKAIAATIRGEIADEISKLKKNDPSFKAKMTLIQVGARPDSSTYVRMKRKAAAEAGITVNFVHMEDTVSENEVLAVINDNNADKTVHGILVQLPLPKHINEHRVTSAVLPTKDIDGFGPYNIGELNSRNGTPYFHPCTPKGVIELLQRSGVKISGANAVVLGRSDIVGIPVSALLRSLDATVTMLHSKSQNIPQHVAHADIIVAAVGQAEFVKGDWLQNPDAVIIDVGINSIEDSTKKSGYRCVGDVEFSKALDKVKLITPVPGGVGPMTVAMLMQNTLLAAKRAAEVSEPFTPLPLDLVQPVPCDFEISRSQNPKDITTVASEAGILPSELEPYGKVKAKVQLDVLNRLKARENGKYILVTGITPTPLGEGKSTTTIGLVQALGAHLKKVAFANVRQPSMGPSFGIKGGAAGGGYSQVIPMDEFNMHVTGDIHAISIATNLLAAAIDSRMFHEGTQKDQALYKRLVPAKNGVRKFLPTMLKRLAKLGIDKTDPDSLTPDEIRQFSRLDIDPSSITWKRVVDCNDRFLRGITVGQAPTERGFTRETGFEISVASECMAILALSNSLSDLRERLGKIVVASNKAGEPVTCEDIGCAGAMAALMKDAIKPTLMQTLEGTPVFVHAGPFANISIGASSIIADKIALKLAGVDPEASEEEKKQQVGYVVTEAGFDFTMGGERFLNIKCRSSGLSPDVIVIVATVRALKVHGGGAEVKAGAPLPSEYSTENVELLRKGCSNLAKQIQNARAYNVPVVVAINKISSDTDLEHEVIKEESIKAGAVDAVIANHWAEGGKGAVDLANAVIKATELPSQDFKYLYDDKSLGIEEKLRCIAREMYGAADISLSDEAKNKIDLYAKQGFGDLPVCIAKTQYSLSHDASLKGVPTDYIFPIRDVKASIGAGYLYALAAEIQTIPGLPTHCGFMNIELNEDGEIEGMF